MAVPTLEGFVAPGYEPVRDLFAKHLADGIEDRAQCCVFVKGIKVVDIWADTMDQNRYTASSIQNIFSSSKVLTSLVVAMLADRGHLRYQQKVAELWPDYGRNGKEDTTVAQVMRHEAGLPTFSGTIQAKDLTAESLHRDSVSGFIADQTPLHAPGEKRMYHAVTRGFIVNEIVRRADPAGRTVGEFLRDEVARPLGLEEELFLGVPESHHHRIAGLRWQRMTLDTWWGLAMPAFLGGGSVPCFSPALRAGFGIGLPLMRLYSSLRKPRPFIVQDEDEGQITRLFNMPAVRRAEIPSANAHASARALATVAAAIAEGGTVHGVRLLSERGIAEAHGDPVFKRMFYVVPTRFTNAGWNRWGTIRTGYVGWMGLGGSSMQWQPRYRIGFGYAGNLMEVTPSNERARVLQVAALRCAKRAAAEAADAPIRDELPAEAGPRSRL